MGSLSEKEVDWGEWFIYDESSPSCLRWKVNIYSGIKLAKLEVTAGDVAGSISCGYYRVQLKGIRYLAHRIIYEMFNGKIPKQMQIGHINGDKVDNRHTNIRCIANALNCRNRGATTANPTGVLGVQLTNRKKGCNYYVATWYREGKKQQKCFSINVHGKERAFALAREYRDKMIAELNAQGAGYTERHGKGI